MKLLLGGGKLEHLVSIRAGRNRHGIVFANGTAIGDLGQ